MTLPIFDPIDLPPDTVLIDINSIDEPQRSQYQAAALMGWAEEVGSDDILELMRDWADNEGVFVVEENGERIGLTIVLDVEAL